ncbi:uncharacterized protein TA04580 [Theileria annulata]|uniref:Calcium load-activated calcium channel n=1 Tax=Theileria annulata TaxID=5874 RepID=Q4UBZ7_THEAN|nr:uncharacterized protein TA04580 [Theileria annulata]CAI75654.1 hypothetical protein, conserved [Theileria annulata]|eukprot:XP_955130.1 hypothetical protein, conserved [Theileria annulata]
MDNDPIVSEVNKRDTVLILLFGVISGVLNEVISWLFIYRKEKFKKSFNELCDAFELYMLSKGYNVVVARSKTMSHGGESPSKVLMEKSKNIKGNLTFSTFITGLLLMGLMPAVMSVFEYSVVAKLPFTPLPPLSMFTHSKLLGNDITDCTATAVYTVISILARQYTKALLGYFPISYSILYRFESPLSPFRESVLQEQVKREK